MIEDQILQAFKKFATSKSLPLQIVTEGCSSSFVDERTRWAWHVYLTAYQDGRLAEQKFRLGLSSEDVLMAIDFASNKME